VPRPRLVHLALLLALAAALGLVVASGRTAREDRAAVLAALRAAGGPRLPGAQAAGASARSEPARYDRETLYELIDGAAEGYLADGFERCVAASYDVAGLEVAAEAHRFASVEGARARLAAERPRGGRALPDLPGAETDGAVLLAVAGRDLLKLTSLDPTRDGSEALRALALAWHRETAP